MKEKVVIGMSGGVDSSVAAALLLKQGYDVVGVTMRLWDGEEVDGELLEGTCCSFSAAEDARYVAYKLGIEHHVMDFRREFENYVVDYFVDEYEKGRTPNPCIACNKHLKFDHLLKKAELLGAKYIATGHYAKVNYNEETKRYELIRSDNTAKDQTYALFNLTQEQLAHTLMPLGDLEDKAKTREIAEEYGLCTAKKPDSQEICFIPDKDYAGFIERRTGITYPTGEFVDINGNVLGKHQGIIRYTIGQRKGLGIAFGKPMFVIKIDSETGRVVLGEKGTEFSVNLIANKLNFISIPEFENGMRVYAKVRYSAAPALAEVYMRGNDEVEVVFDAPQRAVTPGQAVVFYDDIGRVLGGGIIK